MNKIIITMLVISSILLTGCAGNQEKQMPDQITKINQKNNMFENQLFSIILPASYTAENNVIQPKSEKDFPTFVFGFSKVEFESEKLVEFEKEWFKNLWTQTGPSGKFINTEVLTVDGRNGIKFTIQYPGRGYDDSNGYLNEYHYSILNGKNLFRFWTSASDLENPEKTSSQFDEIIETISFK